MHPIVTMERRDRMRGAALRDDVAGATFTLATLGGHAEFELHFVESHAGTRMARDFPVGHSAAYTDDHGGKGNCWLAVGEGLIINTNLSHLQ